MGRTFPLGTPRAFPIKNRIQADLRRKQMKEYGRKRARLKQQVLEEVAGRRSPREQ